MTHTPSIKGNPEPSDTARNGDGIEDTNSCTSASVHESIKKLASAESLKLSDALDWKVIRDEFFPFLR